MIRSFGKAFWYAPGIMVLGATMVSLYEGMGPTTLIVEFLTTIINEFGSEQATAYLSKLIDYQVMTTVTVGLYLVVSDIVERNIWGVKMKKYVVEKPKRSFELKPSIQE